MDHRKDIDEVGDILKSSKSILFITGSGISADSGLPTYRGKGGLYNGKVTEDGVSVEMALAGETLETHPEITWKYLYQIEKGLRSASFNRAHKVIAEMEKEFDRVWVLTQNIDGLHAAAGSKNVIDIHGDMHEILCTTCGWRTRVKNYEGLEIPPHCPKCKSVARPDVVFFGEMLPLDKVNIMSREINKGFDAYFSIGTTSVFPYISQPMIIAKHLGRHTIEINPDITEISDIVDIKLRLGAADALDAIWKAFEEER